MTRGLDDLVKQNRAAATERHEQLQTVTQQIAAVTRGLDDALGLVRSARDDIPRLRRQVAEARLAADYPLAWDEAEPLVTVRIASYRNTAGLMECALPSVLAQTYKNLEIVIVNDGPNEETREAVSALADPRVRYEEFPFRRVYPDDPQHRWMVAGSPGMNEGARLARGRWIAPLDDDDEFSPDHVERLLQLAQAERAELVYGAFDHVQSLTDEHVRVFDYPPRLTRFTFQAAMYHAGLRGLEYDEESWRVGEPGDWNLCRRMMQAGVRIAAVDEVVSSIHYTNFADKRPEA